MIIIGLTGSIGMGKSTTAKLFAEFGVPVHDADAVVHDLYRGEAAPLVEAAFPGTVINGEVSRDELGKRVFGRPDEIRRLEAIVHPLVRAAEESFLKAAEATGHPVVVLDIPLLLETKGDARVHKVVVASAPEHIQTERVLARGTSPERLAQIRVRQVPDHEKRARADFVVETQYGVDHARDRVREILIALGALPGKAAETD